MLDTLMYGHPDMPKDRGPWILTYTGQHYYVCDPSPREVRLADIAHHLAMLCRYTGACAQFFSVAEHSILVSQVVPPEYALAGLLHDAAEAYVGDLSRPLKQSGAVDGHLEIERRNWHAIAARYGVAPELPECVHVADWQVCLAEKAVLMPVDGVPWRHPRYPNTAADVPIHCMSPYMAEKAFLRRFEQITGEIVERGSA